MEWSDIYKILVVIFIGGFMPITAVSFVWVRRRTKEAEFTRMVAQLEIAQDNAAFAHNRVAEAYATRDYILPVTFCWFLSILGLVSLLFGPVLVDDHPGRMNFLLTGLFHDDIESMQRMREQSMVLLSIGFLGAFFWSVRNIIRRLSTGDLAPAAYFAISIRIVIAPIIALMVGHLAVVGTAPADVNLGLVVVAFLIGFFPEEALEYLKEHSPLPVFGRGRAAHHLPLSMIEGMSVYDRARMDELGIDNAQNLATADLIELIIKTPYSPVLLVDWIAQARLFVYFKDNIRELRERQIRTVFDLVVCSEEWVEDAVNEGPGAVDATSISRVRKCLSDDPSVIKLMQYRDALHRIDGMTG